MFELFNQKIWFKSKRIVLKIRMLIKTYTHFSQKKSKTTSPARPKT